MPITDGECLLTFAYRVPIEREATLPDLTYICDPSDDEHCRDLIAVMLQLFNY